MGALTRAGQVLGFILYRTFVEPIREGHLKQNPGHPWPRGMRWLVGISIGWYALLTLLGLLAPGLRAMRLTADAESSIPWISGPFLVLAVLIGLSLAYLAAVHSGWRLRLPLALLLAIVIGGTPGSAGLSGVLIILGTLLVLTAVGWWRRRRGMSVWEFAVALLVIGALFTSRLLTPTLLGGEVQGWGLTLLGFWITLLNLVTAPSTLLAGAAMTEITVALGTWTARGVWEAVPGPVAGTGSEASGQRRPRLIGGLLLAGLWAVAVAREVWLAATDVMMRPTAIPTAVGYLLVAAAIGLAVLHFAPGSSVRGVPLDADDLSRSWSLASWPLAVLLAVSIFGGVFVKLLLGAFGIGEVTQLGGPGVQLAVAGGGSLALGVRWARRGRTAPALLATVFATGVCMAQLSLLLEIPFDGRQVVTASVLLASLLLAGLLFTRRLTADRGLAIASLLVVGRLHEFRDVLDEPLTAIFAASGGGALLLVGLLWRQLTEYAVTRGHSDTVPHYVRVLLALANMTLVGMTVSYYALSGQPGSSVLQVLENAGDSELGGALLMAVLVIGLLLGWRGREGGDQRPGEEFRVDHLILVEPKLDTGPVPR